MSANILNMFYMTGAFMTLFASAEWVYQVKKWQAEITRKYVHIVSGLLTLLFPVLIGNHWLVLTLSIGFVGFLAIAKKHQLLPSVNAIDRASKGGILFPITIYICYLIYYWTADINFYYIPILVLAICDPLAAYFGINHPKGRYKIFGFYKTMSGSLAFLFSAFFITFCFLIPFAPYSILTIFMYALCIATIATIVEGITHHGYDNITIPISIITTMLLAKYIIL